MTNPLIDHVTDALDKARGDDERETVDNRKRGCGHLNANACYIRCDLAALGSPDGDIPPFVEFDDPVEYREHTGRGAIIPGFKAFPGESFTLHYAANGGTTTPAGDVAAHIDRLQRFGFDGDHYAEITSARSIDILMSVGVSNYQSPDDYIEECRTRGLNLKMPVSSNQEPPVIEPLRTRVFIIHPDGCGDGRPGIIGYAYVTRNVFTTGTKATQDDPDVPGWAADFAKTRDDFDLVDRGEPIGEDESPDEAQTTIADAMVDDPDPATVVPSDKPGRDVEEATSATNPDGDPMPTDDGGDLNGSQVVDLKSVDYNVLKAWASTRDDVDAGQSPSKDDLVEAARECGIDAATIRGAGE